MHELDIRTTAAEDRLSKLHEALEAVESLNAARESSSASLRDWADWDASEEKARLDDAVRILTPAQKQGKKRPASVTPSSRELRPRNITFSSAA